MRNNLRNQITQQFYGLEFSLKFGKPMDGSLHREKAPHWAFCSLGRRLTPWCSGDFPTPSIRTCGFMTFPTKSGRNNTFLGTWRSTGDSATPSLPSETSSTCSGALSFTHRRPKQWSAWMTLRYSAQSEDSSPSSRQQDNCWSPDVLMLQIFSTTFSLSMAEYRLAGLTFQTLTVWTWVPILAWFFEWMTASFHFPGDRKLQMEYPGRWWLQRVLGNLRTRRLHGDEKRKEVLQCLFGGLFKQEQTPRKTWRKRTCIPLRLGLTSSLLLLNRKTSTLTRASSCSEGRTKTGKSLGTWECWNQEQSHFSGFIQKQKELLLALVTCIRSHSFLLPTLSLFSGVTMTLLTSMMAFYSTSTPAAGCPASSTGYSLHQEPLTPLFGSALS